MIISVVREGFREACARDEVQRAKERVAGAYFVTKRGGEVDPL